MSAAATQTPSLLGETKAMRELRALIPRLAGNSAPVLITGETGTGKELVARLIHATGPRRVHPFVPVNCGAIPTELMESEFFGHRRGSFTGAVNDHAGLIRSAEGGTLFLDEVAELPLPMQAKLLRVIQDRRVRPLGATGERTVDVRFLSATHRDLDRLISEGRFREDLYYRIDVINLHVPPLRERRADIPSLATHLLARIAAASGLGVPDFAPDALALLEVHDYSGNVRELENILERALALATGDSIRACDLRLRRGPPDHVNGRNMPLAARLDDMRREAIERALRESGGNRSAAARHLGMSTRQLRYHAARLGIKIPSLAR